MISIVAYYMHEDYDTDAVYKVFIWTSLYGSSGCLLVFQYSRIF